MGGSRGVEGFVEVRGILWRKGDAVEQWRGAVELWGVNQKCG